jgi:hypothetical protein
VQEQNRQFTQARQLLICKPPQQGQS